MCLFIIAANIIPEESMPSLYLQSESNAFLPHVILGDECLPLTKCIMTPYTVQDLLQDTKKGIYNKIHCQALEVAGYAFALMAHRYKFFRKHNTLDYSMTKIITQACCCLHNFMRLKELSRKNEQIDENAIKEASEDAEFQPLMPYPGAVSVIGKEVREKFLAYFSSQSNVSVKKEQSLSPPSENGQNTCENVLLPLSQQSTVSIKQESLD